MRILILAKSATAVSRRIRRRLGISKKKAASGAPTPKAAKWKMVYQPTFPPP